MICSSTSLSPRVVYSVVLVEPVELHGIWRAQVELQRGTGGTGAFRWSRSAVPPVTPAGTTKNRQKGLKYHRFHRLPLLHDRPRSSLESIS